MFQKIYTSSIIYKGPILISQYSFHIALLESSPPYMILKSLCNYLTLGLVFLRVHEMNHLSLYTTSSGTMWDWCSIKPFFFFCNEKYRIHLIKFSQVPMSEYFLSPYSFASNALTLLHKSVYPFAFHLNQNEIILRFN